MTARWQHPVAAKQAQTISPSSTALDSGYEVAVPQCIMGKHLSKGHCSRRAVHCSDATV